MEHLVVALRLAGRGSEHLVVALRLAGRGSEHLVVALRLAGRGSEHLSAVREIAESRTSSLSRFQWPSFLRRGSEAFLLLILTIQIPPGARMFVYCVCCTLKTKGENQNNKDKQGRLKHKENTRVNKF